MATSLDRLFSGKQSKGSENELHRIILSDRGVTTPLFDQWIEGHWTTNEILEMLYQHHKELEANSEISDQQAPPNMLGITDTARMKQAEADITTLRMAEMDIERM